MVMVKPNYTTQIDWKCVNFFSRWPRHKTS